MSAEPVKSLGRALKILDCFRERQTALTAKDIAESLELPGSSAFALLRSMVQMGYLLYEPLERTYFPTLLVTDLGSWIPTSLYGLYHPREIMEALRDRTGETVTLSVPNDLWMQFIDTAIGTHAIVLNVRIGDRFSVFDSMIGHAAMTTRDDADLARLIARGQANRPPGFRAIDEPSLHADIEAIRTRGCGVGYDMVIEGLSAVVWPLPTDHPARTLVVAVAGPTNRIRRNEAEIEASGREILERFAARTFKPRKAS